MNHLVAFPHTMPPWASGVAMPGSLYLSGELPDGIVNESYYGTLDIVNAVGACKVRLVSGDLPPGYALSVDNDEMKVVLTWPPYEAEAAPIANMGFEAGDEGWSKGPGWTIGTDNPPSGSYAGMFVNASGESVIRNNALAPCTPGTAIIASCNVRQGASSAGNAGAAVQIEYYNDAGVLFANSRGNIVDSASNNAVKPSTVSAVAPAGTAKVGIAGWAFRRRQNRRLYIDDFSWNVVQATVGVGEPTTYCITLEVEDSVGRLAQYSRCIDVLEGLWVGISTTNSGILRVSDDLVNWINHPISPSVTPDEYTRPFAVGNGQIIYQQLNSANILRFSNPSASTISAQIIAGATNSNNAGFLIYDGGKLIVAQNPSSENNNQIHISRDNGATWQHFAKPSGLISYPANVVRMNRRWVCAGVGNFGSTTKMYYTDNEDPTGWTQVSLTNLSSTNRSFYSLIGNDEAVCALTNTGTCVRTTNGSSWVEFNLPGTDNGDQQRTSLVIGRVFLMQYGQSGGNTLLRSEDSGATWQIINIGITALPLTLAYGNGVIVMGTSTPTILQSFDLGLTWSVLSAPGTYRIGFAGDLSPAPSGMWG